MLNEAAIAGPDALGAAPSSAGLAGRDEELGGAAFGGNLSGLDTAVAGVSGADDDKETLEDAFKKYVAYCTGEERYERRFRMEDVWPAICKVYDLQTIQMKKDWGMYYTMDLSHVKEYYAPASQALLGICKAARTRAYMVVDLLRQGADPNIMEEGTENRPIHYLCRRGCYMGVKYLVEAGADYFALNASHRNALLSASDTSRTGDQVRLVRYLLSLPGYIYKLELRDSGNNTAAINAIFHQNVWILRELLLAGARVTDDHLLDAGQDSAHAVAQWLYAASILSDVDQLPPVALKDQAYEDSHCFYRWTSLKGHYHYAPVLLYQSLWLYGQNLCYRMCQNKKRREDREPRRPKPVTEVRQMADSKARHRLERAMTRELRAAKRRAKELKLVSRELGNEVRELDEWNAAREKMALAIDEEFSKHLRGKADSSTVEWVRKTKVETPASRLKKEQEEKEAVKRARRGGQLEPPPPEPVEWETRLKVGSQYMTAAPPLPKTRMEKIPLNKMLEQRHNRTHSALQQINITTPPEEFYLRVSWVERDHEAEASRRAHAAAKAAQAAASAAGLVPSLSLVTAGSPSSASSSSPSPARKPAAAVKTNEGYKLMKRTPLGLIDQDSQWARSKMTKPLVVAPNSDSSDSDDDDDDASGGEHEGKTSARPSNPRSFSSPKSVPT